MKLYQKKENGKIMFWEIKQEQNILISRWGYLGSVNIQEETYQVESLGRIGTLTYQSPTIAASNEMQRRIKSKLTDGFKETLEEAKNSENNFSYKLIFDNLERGFAPPKPINKKPCENEKDNTLCNIPNNIIRNLESEGRLWAQIKRNGNRAFYITTPNTSKLMSRRMKDMSRNFLPLKKYLDSLSIPSYSIIDMEICIGNGTTNEQFRTVSSMAPNTLPQTATKIYEEWIRNNPEQPLTGFVFDIIFDNQELIKKPYWERYEKLTELFLGGQKIYHEFSESAIPVENFINFKEAFKEVEEINAEGLILWDMEMESKFTMDGKPKRPKGCWKFKKHKTDDFFVIDLDPQKGNKEKVGALHIAQYNKDGNIILRGKVGTGLSDQEKIEVWNWKGKVVEVIYEDEHPINEKGEICLQFSRFCRIREDKPKSECIIDE